MEEGLLFYGITLHPADVPPGHVQLTAFVVPNLADAGLTIRYRATVPTGEAADAIAIQLFDQLRSGFTNALVNNLSQARHNS